jgi:thiol-disulfide isomerase/thioredoxin
MDRLPALIICLCACEGSSTKTEPAPSRVDGAKTKPAKAASLDAFCDLSAPAGTAKRYADPTLTERGPLQEGGGWRWINLWATWCKPCVEEMPRIASWAKRHASVGVSFYSVDESPAEVAEFLAAHPGVQTHGRFGEPYDAWLARLGMTNGSTIPIHVFVDGHGGVRCIRAGSIRDQDFAAIEQLVGGA